MDKYYTPELEEFCLDFKYEEKLNGVYEKKVFDGYTALIKKSFCGDYGDWYDSIEEDIESDRIRVKYLSQEDIESLGWTLDKVHEGKDQELYYKDNIVLYYRYNDKTIGVFTADPSKSDYFSKYNIDPYRIQSLVIKNKSELIKLLKQLQIG